jgi:hypothetical protein
MARTFVVFSRRAVSRRPQGPRANPSPSRLAAYICVLGLYLAFAGVLLGFRYPLWAALAGASTACVVAGEVSRRVITAGVTPADPPGGLAGVLADLTRVLELADADGTAANGARRDG